MKHVFMTGVFDILHPGHRAILKFAKSLGDKLHVAIDGDDRVRQHKGAGRPIFGEYQRMQHLEELRYVDTVTIFHDDEQLSRLIAELKPDILVVGKEYEGKNIIGGISAKQIAYFDYRPTSTTEIIEKLKLLP